VKLASRMLVTITACVAPIAAAAADPFPIISTDELKRRLDAKEDLVLADALSPIEHAEESILGSVNVPYSALRDGRVKLPQDKAKLIVFYCKGPKCTKSVKAAGLAARMGYTQVAVYSEGLPEWMKRGYPAASRKIYPAVQIPAVSAPELKRMLEGRHDLFVLDIRDEDDVARAGIIPGSKSIDLEVLDSRLSEVPKGRKIVLVDLHGKQTQIAGRFLASKGYTDVARLDGGFVGGWLQSGFAIDR
jgi:rhodanese-related sulfurtransferase